MAADQATILTPLITAGATLLSVIIKDIVQVNILNKKGQAKRLQEEQLLKFYNKIFIMYLKYYDSLEIEVEQEIDVDDDIGVIYDQLTFDIKNIEIWNDIIAETRELIHENIHLLTYSDLHVWNKFEKGWKPTFKDESELIGQYESFKSFLERAVRTYGRLYLEFQGIAKKKRKIDIIQRKKSIKQLIRQAKEDPMLDKKKRKLKTRRLKKRLREIRKEQLFAWMKKEDFTI